MIENIYQIEDINYMVSLFCPGKCRNCSIWKEPFESITQNEISPEIFEKILKSNSLANTNYFNLTAGESQISSKYPEIVRLITKYKPDAFIHTNISGWYPEKHFEVTKECLKWAKPDKFRLDISLDGRKESYEQVRFVENGFDKAVKSAEKLIDLGILVRFVMVLYRETWHDIEWFVDFAKKTGAGFYLGYPRKSENYIKSNEKSNYFTKEELDMLEEKLKKAGWLTERRISNWLWAKSVYEDRVPYFNCLMGKKHLVIDPYGNVYPCNELKKEHLMGNINEFHGNLDNLLYSEKALSVIKFIEEKKCQPCGMLCAPKVEFPWGKQDGMIAPEKINV